MPRKGKKKASDLTLNLAGDPDLPEQDDLALLKDM
jgi:hypothetical protein